MIVRGDATEARPLLEALDSSQTPSVDQTQVQFLLGMVAAAEGEHVRAIEIFRAILETRPELTRVRLELARALFAAEDDSAAAYHFRLALAEAPSDGVRQNIERYLSAIEQRRDYIFEVGFSLMPDTNVNAATNEETINLFGFLPSDLSDDAQETSGVGLRGSLAAGWLPRLNKDWRLQLRGAAVATDYAGVRFDDQLALTQIGARRLFERGYVDAGASYEKRYFGGEAFYDALGVRVSGAWRQSPRLTAFASGARTQYEYTVEAGRDGPVSSLSAGLSYALSSRSIASVQASVAYEDSEAKVRRNTAYSLQASYAREYANAFTLEVTPFAAYRPFEGFDPIFGATREDARYGVTLEGLNRTLRYRGFSPALAYTFTRNESNVVLYDYTRHQVELRLTRAF